MSTIGGLNIVRDKLSLYYDFSNIKSYIGSGSSVKDINKKYDSSINGSTNHISSYKGYLRLDGSTNYIDVTGWDNTLTNNKITVEFYGRLRELDNVFKILFGFNLYDFTITSSYGGDSGMGFNTGNGDLYGISLADVNSLNLIGTEHENWHHYVLVFDEVSYTNGKIYIDGVAQSLSQIRNSETTAHTIIGTDFRIGGWRYGAGYHPNMDLGYIRLYNKELSASEVLQNYNAVKNRYLSVLDYVSTDLVCNLDGKNASSYGGSGTTWTDLSGTGNNATLENGTAYNSNGTFELDGVNDVITILHSADLELSTSFSIDVWVRIDTNGGDFIVLADKRPSSGGDNNATFGLYIDNRQVVRTWNASGTDTMVLAFGMGNGSSTFYVWGDELCGVTDGDNQWHNVCGTINTGTKTIKLYYDGSLIMSNQYTGTLAQNAQEISIGNEYTPNSNDYPLFGDIGIFRIYNKALSAEEVLKNFNALKRRYE